MLTLAFLIVFACVVLPALAWALGLVFRIFGWTLRMVFGLLLAPLWIVLALVGGLAAACQALVPLALVALIVMAIIPER